jgi:hypothetical protein
MRLPLIPLTVAITGASIAALLRLGGFAAWDGPVPRAPADRLPSRVESTSILPSPETSSTLVSSGRSETGDSAEASDSTKSSGGESPDPTGLLEDFDPANRVSLVTARLEAVARQSADRAIVEAIGFCDEDPSYSLEYGRALITALARQGEYAAALRFVLAEDAEGWLEENGSKWLTSLFSTWAREAPQQALQTAETIVSAGARFEALQVVGALWAQADPAGFTHFIHQSPPTMEREQLLKTVQLSWRTGQ